MRESTRESAKRVERAHRPPIIPIVDRRLSTDTSPGIEERQIVAWRNMSAGEKLQLALQMSTTVRLTLAGIAAYRITPRASEAPEGGVGDPIVG